MVSLRTCGVFKLGTSFWNFRVWKNCVNIHKQAYGQHSKKISSSAHWTDATEKSRICKITFPFHRFSLDSWLNSKAISNTSSGRKFSVQHRPDVNLKLLPLKDLVSCTFNIWIHTFKANMPFTKKMQSNMEENFSSTEYKQWSPVKL